MLCISSLLGLDVLGQTHTHSTETASGGLLASLVSRTIASTIWTFSVKTTTKSVSYLYTRQETIPLGLNSLSRVQCSSTEVKKSIGEASERQRRLVWNWQSHKHEREGESREERPSALASPLTDGYFDDSALYIWGCARELQYHTLNVTAS